MTAAPTAAPATEQPVNLRPSFDWEDPLMLEELLGEDERMVRDARVQAIGGGATEVMLEEVAKRMEP